MAEPAPIRKVVIAGRDEALWLAANILWSSFNKAGIEITAVELPSQLRPGDVFATLRAQEGFHTLMGLEETPLMRASQATYTLGQRFANFARSRPPFIHAYGSYGRPIERVLFHHHWIKARSKGLKAEYDDFSLAAVAARQGRFFVADADIQSFAECDYGYHLGAIAYCQVLRQVALQRKVGHVASRIAEVVKDPHTGHITRLLLMNGQSVDGDLFIDATGAESLLLGETMGGGIDSWASWFPCDRVLTTFAPALSPLPAFSQVSAFRSGWLGLFPLRDRTAVQQVYASTDMTEQEALETAATVSSLRLHPEAVVTPFSAGVRRDCWIGNCIAVGDAAAVFDPIDSVRMHSVLAGISHLVNLFPINSDMAAESREYNRNIRSTYERMRDFQICHYKLNQRFDQPLWDYCRATPAPDLLAYKLNMFGARGSLVVYDDETFYEDEWIAMLIGHGLIPKAYDPLADQVEDGEIIQRFQRMLGFIRAQVERMKPMEAQFGTAAPV